MTFWSYVCCFFFNVIAYKYFGGYVKESALVIMNIYAVVIENVIALKDPDYWSNLYMTFLPLASGSQMADALWRIFGLQVIADPRLRSAR